MQGSLIDQQISFASIGYSSNHYQCIEKNEAMLICANPQCHQRLFVCSSDQCKCNMLHETCLLVSPQSLKKKIEMKIIDPTVIIDEINRIVDRCIDEISDWRDRLLTQVKYYGLTDMEKQYLVAVNSNNTQNIKGSIVFQALKSVHTPNEQNKLMQTIKLIQCYWEKQKEKFNSIFKNLEGLIFETPLNSNSNSNSNSKSNDYDYDQNFYQSLHSKVIESNQQFKTLCSFFSKKIKKFKLLYRGSQNSFTLGYFYRQCSFVPQTLVLVHTGYGKKIGGYTTCGWWKRDMNQFDSYWQKDSFIFSLTNGDKFQLIQPKKSLQCICDDAGPRFGGKQETADLIIGDCSNKRGTSYAVFNTSYFNKKYKRGDSESYRKFTGGQTQYFTTKQWEVYEVIFAD